jgi:hypothetical protein
LQAIRFTSNARPLRSRSGLDGRPIPLGWVLLLGSIPHDHRVCEEHRIRYDDPLPLFCRDDRRPGQDVVDSPFGPRYIDRIADPEGFLKSSRMPAKKF